MSNQDTATDYAQWHAAHKARQKGMMVIGILVAALGLLVCTVALLEISAGSAASRVGIALGLALSLSGAWIGYGARRHARDEASHPACYQMALIEKEHAAGWFEHAPESHWRWRHATGIDRLIARAGRLFFILTGVTALGGGALLALDVQVPLHLLVGASLACLALHVASSHIYAARIDWRLARSIAGQHPSA